MCPSRDSRISTGFSLPTGGGVIGPPSSVDHCRACSSSERETRYQARSAGCEEPGTASQAQATIGTSAEDGPGRGRDVIGWSRTKLHATSIANASARRRRAGAVHQPFPCPVVEGGGEVTASKRSAAAYRPAASKSPPAYLSRASHSAGIDGLGIRDGPGGRRLGGRQDRPADAESRRHTGDTATIDEQYRRAGTALHAGSAIGLGAWGLGLGLRNFLEPASASSLKPRAFTV